MRIKKLFTLSKLYVRDIWNIIVYFSAKQTRKQVCTQNSAWKEKKGNFFTQVRRNNFYSLQKILSWRKFFAWDIILVFSVRFVKHVDLFIFPAEAKIIISHKCSQDMPGLHENSVWLHFPTFFLCWLVCIVYFDALINHANKAKTISLFLPG